MARKESPVDRRIETFPFACYGNTSNSQDLAQVVDCDVLFVPGGASGGDFRPTVAFSQNLQPFDSRELLRFGWSYCAWSLLSAGGWAWSLVDLG